MTKRIMLYLANGLGDVVFSIPAMMELRRLYPFHKFCIFGWEENVSLIHSEHFGDEFYEIPHPQSLVRYLMQHPCLLLRRYEAAYTFRSNIGRLMLMRYMGIIGKIYSVKTTDNYKFDYFIKFSEFQPMWMQDMETLKLAGLSPNFKHIQPELFLTNKEKFEGQEILKEIGVRQSPILIHPSWTSVGQIKALPFRLVKELFEKFEEMGESPWILLGANEKRFLDFSGVESLPKDRIICRNLSSRQLAAVLACAKLIISADSGPAHIADVVHTPVFSLWGPTSPTVNGMFYSIENQRQSSFECSSCYQRHFFLQQCFFSSPCMQSFSVERLVKDIFTLLSTDANNKRNHTK